VTNLAIRITADAHQAISEINRVRASLGSLGSTAKAVQSQVATPLTGVSSLFSRLRGIVSSVSTLLSELAGKIPGVSSLFSGLGANISGVITQGAAMGAAFAVVGAALTALASAVSKVVDFIRSGIAEFMRFEWALQKVAVVSGASAEQMSLLEKRAVELASSSIYSATTIAEAMEYMALAGMSAEEIYSAIPGVIEIATMESMDLAEAADIAMAAMHSFGYEADYLVIALNALSSASDLGAVSLRELGEALKYVGPLARVAGASIGEVSAAMAVLADVGIKGSIAGTTLRRSLLTIIELQGKLSGVTREMADAIALRAAMRSVEGSRINFIRFFEELKKEMESLGLTASQQAEVIRNVFGTWAAAGAAELTSNVEKLKEAFEKITFTEIKAALEHAIFEPSFEGRRALEELGIQIASTYADLPRMISDTLLALRNLGDEQQQLNTACRIFGHEVGPLVVDILRSESMSIDELTKKIMLQNTLHQRAALMMQTTTAATQELKNAWRAFSATIGSVFAPAIKVIANALKELVSALHKTDLSPITNTFKVLAKVLVAPIKLLTLLIKASNTLKEKLGALYHVLNPIAMIFKMLSALLKGLRGDTKAAAEEFHAFAVVGLKLLRVLAYLAQAILSLGAFLKRIKEVGFRKAWEEYKSALAEVWKMYSPEEIFKKTEETKKEVAETEKAEVKSTIIEEVKTEIKEVTAAPVSEVVSQIQPSFSAASTSALTVADTMKHLGTSTKQLRESAEKASGGLIALGSSVEKLNEKIKETTTKPEPTKEVREEPMSLSEWIHTQFETMRENLRAYYEKVAARVPTRPFRIVYAFTRAIGGEAVRRAAMRRAAEGEPKDLLSLIRNILKGIIIGFRAVITGLMNISAILIEQTSALLFIASYLKLLTGAFLTKWMAQLAGLKPKEELGLIRRLLVSYEALTKTFESHASTLSSLVSQTRSYFSFASKAMSDLSSLLKGKGRGANYEINIDIHIGEVNTLSDLDTFLKDLVERINEEMSRIPEEEPEESSLLELPPME